MSRIKRKSGVTERETNPKKLDIKVKFRNYKYYPDNLIPAAIFRDAYDDFPDGAFFAFAEEEQIMDLLISLAEWETANTYHESEK